MICKYCNIEYVEDQVKCSDCGAYLIKNENRQKGKDRKTDWLFSFGKITAQRAVSVLFFLGLMPLLATAYNFSNYVYINNRYLQNADLHFENGFRAEFMSTFQIILTFIIYFIAAALLWKIICELLIIIFRCFETYVNKNKQ